MLPRSPLFLAEDISVRNNGVAGLVGFESEFKICLRYYLRIRFYEALAVRSKSRVAEKTLEPSHNRSRNLVKGLCDLV